VRILVVNAGSSSVKLRVVDDGDELVASRDLGAPDPAGSAASALGDALADLGTFDAVGHRIVHGGLRYTGPVLVDDQVLADLHDLVDLAPLHQPAGLDAIAAVARRAPDVPAVACFDTAFHATLPAAASTYAIPAEWRRLGVRRFGFHGLAHAYATRRAAELLGRPVAELRVVTCHLGSGASVTAVAAGVSVDTSMGFTPLEGLVMATRSGSLDPGAIVWLQQHVGMRAEEVGDALERRSGLLGLAGTADMRSVLAAAEAGDDTARQALDVYVHRLRQWIGAMAAAMDGLDALVFTGGVGERAPSVRARAVAGLSHLGLGVDPAANALDGEDRDVSRPTARARTLVVDAREDFEIAREVRVVLGERDREAP
jgi:acetate kinase